jgi:thioredoxin 1
MSTRRALLAAAILLLAGSPALCAEKAPFTPEAFASAQAADASILVDIDAPWCPTCKAQRPILDRLESAPKFAKLKVFRVDFDSQKDVVRSLRATTQSTLIVFKGKAETGRSVGETDADAIAALLDKAL